MLKSIKLLEKFETYLEMDGKSQNTVKTYTRHIKNYLSWFKYSYSNDFSKLYRENILDYKSYLLNVKNLNGKTVNTKMAALIKFNIFLIEEGIQKDLVLSKADYLKVQTQYASPAIIDKSDVEKLRQKILENESKRDYAIVTLLAYSGMRISEVVNLKVDDVNLTAREILVRSGKGEKQRVVIINDKIANAIKGYLKEREKMTYNYSEYLFISRQSEKISRHRINKLFKKYSDKITPHTLRHFFCSYALESGWSVHEVASQVGHSNVQTTLIYTNPSRKEMLRKVNLL